MEELPEPKCEDCKALYGAARDAMGNVLGRCRRRPELGDVPASMKYCYLFTVIESRAAYVKNVMPASSATKRGGPRVSHGSPSQKHVATLRDPVLGDTDGEITMDKDGLKQVLRELLEEETMYGFPQMGGKWEEGVMILKPSDPELAVKEIPLEAFFHKIVMVRDKLRVLEAKINGSEKLAEQDKVELQGYISKCYGSLTTFNALFRDKSDHFSSK